VEVERARDSSTEIRGLSTEGLLATEVSVGHQRYVSALNKLQQVETPASMTLQTLDLHDAQILGAVLQTSQIASTGRCREGPETVWREPEAGFGTHGGLIKRPASAL
jgi:hypothetical protein